MPLTLPTSLHSIGSFGLTCSSGLLPALGGAPWAYALVEKQTAVRITRAFIVISPSPSAPERLNGLPFVGTGEYESGVRWKKPQGIRALRLRAGFKNRLCVIVARPGLYRLASASRERESKMLFHQRNNSSVATRTHHSPSKRPELELACSKISTSIRRFQHQEDFNIDKLWDRRTRAEESEEDADQRGRIWYVACTRARDLLVLPSIPQAAKDSWFSSINLRQNELPELDLSAFPKPTARPAPSSTNEQSAHVFAAEQRRIEENATPIVWRRPSDHDPDRLGDPLESVVIAEAVAEHPDIVGAGALRGIILHKLIEEFLTGELVSTKKAATARADVLLSQLVSGGGDNGPRPEPLEMADTALRALALPEIAVLRPYLVPELAIWAARDTYLVSPDHSEALQGTSVRRLW